MRIVLDSPGDENIRTLENGCRESSLLLHIETATEFFAASPPMGLKTVKAAELLLF